MLKSRKGPQLAPVWDADKSHEGIQLKSYEKSMSKSSMNVLMWLPGSAEVQVSACSGA